MIASLTIFILVCNGNHANADVNIITEPQAGEEYVLVSSRQQRPVKNFEMSHKILEKLPLVEMTQHSGKVKFPVEGIVAVDGNSKSLLKKRQSEKKPESLQKLVPVLGLKNKMRDLETNPAKSVGLETMSDSKKTTKMTDFSTQRPILTTTPLNTKAYNYIPINFDNIDDINSGLLSSNLQFEPAGSEQKQHSRIQIKKGPNGQDYEYEYVYYYYDEEDGKKEDKDFKYKPSPTILMAVKNSHDGSQMVQVDNRITKGSKYSTIEKSTLTSASTIDNQNEILPTVSRSREKGQTFTSAPVGEVIEGDSTRFPTRGRTLSAWSSTTYVPELAPETVKQSRGRMQQTDNVADESIGQTRARAHIRRPSSELVDLKSFKTHSEDIPLLYKEPPTRYSSESKATTESPEIMEDMYKEKYSSREGHSLEPNVRFQKITDVTKLPIDYITTTAYEQEETTEYTTMIKMEKVALDLYAYLARENLNNELNDVTDFGGVTTVEDGAWTTEAMNTTVVPTTTTTTTTTTTPAPTTAATVSRPTRFRGRSGSKSRAFISTTTATVAPQEITTKARGRFGKPSAIRKSVIAATAVPLEASSLVPAAEKIFTKQAFGRRPLLSGRTSPSSSTVILQDFSSSYSETPAPRSRLRLGLRRTTTGSTASPLDDSAAVGHSSEPTDSTPIPGSATGRGRAGLQSTAAALRPGARLNIRPNPRLRHTQTSEPTTEPTPNDETIALEAPFTDTDGEVSEATPVFEHSTRGGIKLRNRLQVSPSPKPRVTVTVAARRPNPLLKRRITLTEVTSEALKTSSPVTTEGNIGVENSEMETDTAPMENTAAPLRGLNALFARRRVTGGIGARTARSY